MVGQDLDGDVPCIRGISGAIHLSHAAAADERDKVVVAESLAGQIGRFGRQQRRCSLSQEGVAVGRRAQQ
jgi:hypothetical protein